MDIRTKLVIALVMTSLTCMGALGYFGFVTAAEFLKEISERQLNAVAEAKAADVHKVAESWRDRVRLVASRTQLRLNLKRYNQAPTPELAASVQRIIEDARQATPSVQGIVVTDLQNHTLARSGDPGCQQCELSVPEPGIHFLGLCPALDCVRFSTALELEDTRIGTLLVSLDMQELEAVRRNTTGLGELGETIIAMRGADGTPRILHALRHNVDTFSSFPVLNEAVQGKEATYMQDHIDYRGREVWAATRYLDDLAWGLVVQVDREEELQRTRRLGDLLIDVGLSIGAFAIVGGTLLGIYLAAPIRRLTDTVERISSGEVELRASVGTEDEVAQLASALNEVLDHQDRPPP